MKTRVVALLLMTVLAWVTLPAGAFHGLHHHEETSCEPVNEDLPSVSSVHEHCPVFLFDADDFVFAGSVFGTAETICRHELQQVHPCGPAGPVPGILSSRAPPEVIS